MKVLGAALVASLLAAVPLQVKTGDGTFGLVAAGGSIWAGGVGSGKVLRIDPSSGKVVARVAAGTRIFGLAAAPGAVWALGNTSETAVRIDTRTGKATARLRVGPRPYGIAWGFGSIWVSNAGDGTVTRITGTRIVARIKTGTEPNGLVAARGFVVGERSHRRATRAHRSAARTRSRAG